MDVAAAEAQNAIYRRMTVEAKLLASQALRNFAWEVKRSGLMRVAVSPGASFSFGKPDLASTPPANATLFWDVGPGNVVYWVTHKPPRTFIVVHWAHEVDSLLHSASSMQR